MIVVDTSVAVKWLVEEDDSDRAAALLGQALIAPDLLVAECANALWKKFRRREVEQAHILFALASVESFVRLMPSRGLAVRALAIAAELEHPVYDCFYLALAEEANAELVTADRRFATAIRRAAIKTRLVMLEERE